jgi:dTDP-4-amino-4,6-dideoxygalactose transaminase
MAEVPFLDLGAAYEELAPELDAAYREVMSSGRYLFGEQLSSFEAEFAAYSGAADCVGLRTGFDSLTLGLRALGVGAGDEVLVPTNTTAITWMAVAAVGAVPVGVEPTEVNHTIDSDRLETARTPRTRAVVPVHLYGRPADMPAVLAWARASGVRVLADAAQAHGARIAGEPVGAFGDAVAWSLYPSKNLGAFADGGCLTSDSPDLIARTRRLRNYGYASRDEAVEVGINSRLDELQAAFLRVRLVHLDEWNARRRANANLYLEALGDLPLVLPPADEDVEGSWHQFVIRVADRDRVRNALAEAGVETLVHYPTPPFAQPVFAHLGIATGTFPIAERLAAEVLSLPIGPHLPSEGAEKVVDALRSALVAHTT